MEYNRYRLCLRVFGDELLKMFPGRGDIELCEGGGDLGAGAGHDHHDVRVTREHVNVGGELRVAHLHAAELGLRLRAADLELLDDVRDALEAMTVIVLRPIHTQTLQQASVRSTTMK